MTPRPMALALAAWVLLAAAGAAAEPQLDGVAVNRALAVGSADAAPGIFVRPRPRPASGAGTGGGAINGTLTNATVASGNANVSTGRAHGGLPDWQRARFGR